MNNAIFNYLNSFAGQSEWGDFVIRFLAQYLWYLIILVFILVLCVDKKIGFKIKIYWLLLTLFSAGVARLGLTELIRYFYHHPRPPGVALLLENSSSFPSGHTIFIFAFATVVYFYNKRVGYWLGVGGILVGLARVVAGVHWPSDILGGAILGITVGLIIHRLSLSIQNDFK